MRSSLECIPCYFRQVLNVAGKVTSNRKLLLSLFIRIGELLKQLPLNRSPAENTYYVLKKINSAIGCGDPFFSEKKRCNTLAMKMYPGLKRMVKSSKDPLYTALKVAVAGNVIDLGILKSFDINEALKDIFEKGFVIDHYRQFKKNLDKARNILYLADNAGELVFDKVLIEQLAGRNVTVVINKGPILNDATMEDARDIGLLKTANVITSGSDTIGKIPKSGSKEYKRYFSSADMVIAKGHGNYETLDNLNKNIFFILKAKCEAVAKNLGVKCGDMVLMQSRNYRPGKK